MNNVDEEDEDGHKEERVNSVYTKKNTKILLFRRQSSSNKIR